MVNAAFGSRRKASTGFTSSLACNAFFVQRSFRRRRFSPSVSRRARHSSKNCSARISLSRLHLRGGQTDTSLFERRDIFPTFVNPASLPSVASRLRPCPTESFCERPRDSRSDFLGQHCWVLHPGLKLPEDVSITKAG
jgi:hypothetical protein